MKTVIKTSIGGPFLRPYFTAIVLSLLAFAPRAGAVIPPPDGGYPGENTAEGQDALLNLTTGSFNTAVGYESLWSNTTGAFNTGVGAETLHENTGDEITALGAFALFSNTTGQFNTAAGAFALLSNTIGQNNTATGFGALQTNTTGTESTAIGASALYNDKGVGYNTATGAFALFSNTRGAENIAIGDESLMSNTVGNNNNAIGSLSLHDNTRGGANTGVGDKVLISNTAGNNNVAVGQSALQSNKTGNQNTAIGSLTLPSSTGSNNIAVGFESGENVSTANNVICIGTNVRGNNVNDACYIGNIFGSTSSNGVAVFVNSNGRLGTRTSSARFKNEIKPMDKASEAILALRPVSFRYKKEIDPARTSQFGLVAEEVEKVNRDLVVRDKEGKAYSVRYDQVNAMLLNEFLKEHHQVQDLKTIVTGQQKRIEALTAGLQKVSAEIQMSKPATKIVSSHP
jgi:hypothetical protein